MRYDCIIIGSGPAGLSAALNLSIHKKKLLWFGDAKFSEKVRKAERVDNYPGLPGVDGAELSEAFLRHAKEAGLQITDKTVSNIYEMGDYYAVMAENEFYETNTVIIATGVVASNPYDGETEYLGRGVSYCATCDGALYKDKTIAVISTAKRFEHEVKFLTDLAKTVYFLPFYKDCEVEGDNIRRLLQAPKAVTGNMRVEKLILAKEELAVDGVFILRSAIAPTTLLPSLTVEEGHIVTDRSMKTNLPGVYAAGDCTGKPYQYTKAVGEGNVAAHSVIEYLGEK